MRGLAITQGVRSKLAGIGERWSTYAEARWAITLLWIGAFTVAGALVLVRFRAAIHDQGHDFVHYFLPAGRLVEQGASPYLAPGYVYSPLVSVLASLASDSPTPMVWWTWANLAVGTAAVAVLTAAFWGALRAWQRPFLFAVAMVALFYNWLTTLMLGSGQTDLFVMLGLALSTYGAQRRQPATAGLGIAWGGLMKTWPFVISLWLLRRGEPRRTTAIVTELGLTAVVLAGTATAFGPRAVVGWMQNVTAARSQPGLIHFSVQHLGSQLFANGVDGLSSLAVLPALAIVVDVVGVLGAAGLLGLCLFRPGDPALSLWHTTLLCVLLLPVSHSVYLIYGIPILLIWVVRALSGYQRGRTLPMLAGWLVWWVLCFRVQWSGDTFTTMSTVGYVVVMLSTLVMTGWSVITEAQSTRPVPRTDPGER